VQLFTSKYHYSLEILNVISICQNAVEINTRAVHRPPYVCTAPGLFIKIDSS